MNKIIREVIKLNGVIRVGSNPMTEIIIKSGNLDRDTQGECH